MNTNEPFQAAVPLGVREGDNGLLLTLQEQKALEAYEEGKERLKQHHKADAEAREEAEKERQALRRARTRTAATFTAKNPEWLWATEGGEYGRIPKNQITLLVGKGGVGKTTLECMLMAWLTNGEMKGQFWRQPKNVLFVPYEDDIEDCILPRLMSWNADLERVHFLTMEQLGAGEEDVLLPTDCEEIGREAQRLDAALIAIDPISAALSVDNGNDQKKVRAAVQRVQSMCMRYQLTALGIAHTRKAVSHSLMDAIMGSSELSNVARAAIGLIADPDQPGTLVMSQEKNNKGRMDIPGYRYRIVGDTVWEGQTAIKSSRIEFMEKVEPQKVSEIMSDNASGGSMITKSAVDEAKEFLREYLMSHGGVAPRGKTIQAGKADGHSQRTLERAARILGIQSVPSGYGASRNYAIPVAGLAE